MSKTQKQVKRVVKSVKLDVGQRIVVLPAGKANPRRAGSAPYKRYAVLLKSRTVGAFLKSQPKWRGTIVRALKEQRIRVA
jgi:hypothetical protein